MEEPKGIAVRLLDRAKKPQIPSPPTQDFWFVEDQLIVAVGDKVHKHKLSPKHKKYPPMVTGSTWMAIDNNTMQGKLWDVGNNTFGRFMLAVCKEGDKAKCGHATTGRTWWLIS